MQYIYSAPEIYRTGKAFIDATRWYWQNEDLYKLGIVGGGGAGNDNVNRNENKGKSDVSIPKGAGKVKWTGKDFNNIGKNFTPNELINSLENSGWTKTVEAGGVKSGSATILTDPATGTKVRIHATPGDGTPYFRVQNKGGGYLDNNGLFPSNATKQELRNLTHFYFGQ